MRRTSADIKVSGAWPVSSDLDEHATSWRLTLRNQQELDYDLQNSTNLPSPVLQIPSASPATPRPTDIPLPTTPPEQHPHDWPTSSLMATEPHVVDGDAAQRKGKASCHNSHRGSTKVSPVLLIPSPWSTSPQPSLPPAASPFSRSAMGMHTPYFFAPLAVLVTGLEGSHESSEQTPLPTLSLLHRLLARLPYFPLTGSQVPGAWPEALSSTDVVGSEVHAGGDAAIGFSSSSEVDHRGTTQQVTFMRNRRSAFRPVQSLRDMCNVH